MKNQFMLVCGMLLTTSSAFAAKSYKCEPAPGNGYFSDTVVVQIPTAKQIKIKNQILDLDTSYKPKFATNYKRYIGETERASNWVDSGLVEIFFDGAKRLKFTVRGETFISETFNCVRN